MLLANCDWCGRPLPAKVEADETAPVFCSEECYSEERESVKADRESPENV